MKAIFVTGTDTGIGKTVVTGLLARYLLNRSVNVVTQKWIQTGSDDYPEDIAVHLELMGKQKEDFEKYLPYICPYTFKLPASPHLAAEVENETIDPAKIESSFTKLTENFDTVIVEGLGGVLVPFSRNELVVDIACKLNLPVLIAAQNKLGAINHTLLTIEAVKNRGMDIVGVVFNGMVTDEENKVILEDNPRIIEELTGEKILGTLPWLEDMGLLHKAFEAIGDKIRN